MANTANKKVKYAIDGGEYTESEAEALVIELEAGNHMIEIVTNQSSGDCNLSAPKLVKRVATALDNAADEVKAVKRIENGQLLIEKNGRTYSAILNSGIAASNRDAPCGCTATPGQFFNRRSTEQTACGTQRPCTSTTAKSQFNCFAAQGSNLTLIAAEGRLYRSHDLR